MFKNYKIKNLKILMCFRRRHFEENERQHWKHQGLHESDKEFQKQKRERNEIRNKE